ncbi:hypothetical protein APHAL10511_002786 [Amanita phalloides]|nr:hypothetical protein APHAL10511_002786 [Amanita phalloides]
MLRQRIKVLDWYQTKTAEHFAPMYLNLKIRQPLVSDWVRNESKWWEEMLQAKQGVNGKACKNAKWPLQAEHPKINEMLELWVQRAMENKVHITGDVLCQKWRDFAVWASIPEDEQLNLSSRWLTHFKHRNNLKHIKRHGEAGSSDMETVEKEQKCGQELVKKLGYAERDI